MSNIGIAIQQLGDTTHPHLKGVNVASDLSTYQTMVASWRDVSVAIPSESDINAQIAIIEANEYQADRQATYPAIGDQLDAIWKQLIQDRLNGHAMIQEVDDLIGQINAVKAAHPKP